MPDAELVTDAAPRDPTQMLDAFLVAAVRPPLRRLGPPAGRVVGLFVGLVAATTSLAYVGAHAADAHTPAQLAVGVLGVVVVAAWAALECAALAAPYAPVATADAESGAKAEPAPAPGDALAPWRAGAEFAVWMLFIYACDRTDLVARGEKHTSQKSFWCLWGLICLAAACTVRSCRAPRVLAREQTEEWKGWMQLMFLLYHYFAQAQLYNAIRVYIAAYVWMTGYGNFLYYQKTGNFGAVRVCQTLFRLNFFVVVVCVALRNEYMLYYIAPMHTLFTLFVWLALRIARARNDDARVLVVKVVSTLLLTALLYDVEAVFRFAFGWQPMRALVAFHDPLHPEFTDELHEWRFRSGLDRYVWVFGMACAALFPVLSRALARVDAAEAAARRAIRGAVVAALLGAIYVYHDAVFSLDKYAYNGYHPYTSWLPILVYILLRNLTPALRARYVHLFTFLGQVTLETYILQFHVWMKTTGLNGSPKFLLVLIEGHFWLNFAVVSAAYFLVSVRVFRLTCALRDALVPDDARDLPRALAVLGGVVAVLAAAGHGLRAAVPAPLAAAAAVGE